MVKYSSSSPTNSCSPSLNTKAILKTSSASFAGCIISCFNITSGTSLRSFTFSSGIITSLTPALYAAIIFSFRPPIGSTCPLIVISPVIATWRFTGLFVKADTSDVAIVTPALGPSLGIAASVACICMSVFE